MRRYNWLCLLLWIAIPLTHRAVADEPFRPLSYPSGVQPLTSTSMAGPFEHRGSWFGSSGEITPTAATIAADPLYDPLIKPASHSVDLVWPDFDGPHSCPAPYSHTDERWTWQKMPSGLMYHSYIAGEREPRFGLSIMNRQQSGTIWEVALGGRVGILRYGNTDTVRPEGWQLDMEGAALPRLNQDAGQDLDMVDFRFGVPLTYRKGPWAFKFAYFHISSHVGDEYIDRNPGFKRINYVRDGIVLGSTYNIREDVLVYGEVGLAPSPSDGAGKWHLQFGGEWAPTMQRCVTSGPVVAANGHIREEVDWGGSINLIAGWQWRGQHTDKVWRMGLQYYNGKSMQYEFFEDNDTLIGGGMWYDF